MKGQVITLILGGGQGKRLFPLTSVRSKPAVPIGGKYRLVDIPISNSINSGMRRIFILTQFNSTSLHRHIHRTYPYEPFTQTSVELLAAEQTFANTDWFQGTADAVRKHLTHYNGQPNDTVLILSGDHLYRMDYREILKFHEDNGADVTIATVPVTKKDVSQFGIMQLRTDGRIHAFREKPSGKENIHSFVIPANIRKIFHVTGKREQYLASMGVYVFKHEVLKNLLSGNEADFGKEVIPKSIEHSKVFGYVFPGYWRDIGTIQGFYEANIDLTRPEPAYSFLDPSGRIFTRPRFLPPSKIISTHLTNVLFGEGCYLTGVDVRDSVIGVRSVVGKATKIIKSVLMGNDFYDPYPGTPEGYFGIGEKCRIERCIIDKNVKIGNHVTIANEAGVQEKDGDNFYIRDGIVIIPKGARIPDGVII